MNNTITEVSFAYFSFQRKVWSKKSRLAFKLFYQCIIRIDVSFNTSDLLVCVTGETVIGAFNHGYENCIKAGSNVPVVARVINTGVKDYIHHLAVFFVARPYILAGVNKCLTDCLSGVSCIERPEVTENFRI